MKSYRQAELLDGETADIFRQRLHDAGDPIILFADALYLLGNESETDDVEGLADMIAAAEHAPNSESDKAIRIIERQTASTLKDFEERGLEDKVRAAKTQAAKRRYITPERRPDDAAAFAACYE